MSSSIKFCYYIYEQTLSNAHLALLFVLRGNVPDWNNIQNLQKPKIVLLNFAIRFTTKLHPMHTLFCCVCCWALVLTGTICKN